MPRDTAPDDSLASRLPLPLAQLYRRAHNAKTPLERHLSAFYFWEAGLKMLAAAAVVTYRQRELCDPSLEAVLSSLDRPSLGVWWDIARRLTPILSDAGETGYKTIRDVLLGRARDDLPRAAGLDAVLRETLEAKSGARSTVRVGELFDRLLRWRNEDVGHGAAGQRRGDFYERTGPALLLGLAEIFSALDVLAGRRLHFVGDVRRLASGAWLVERFELHGDSPRRLESYELAESEVARLPRPGWLYLADDSGGATALHPFVIYDENAGKTLFFNTRRSAARSDYLCYTTGEIVHLTPGAAIRSATTGDAPWDGTTGDAAPSTEQPAPPPPTPVDGSAGSQGRMLGEFELISRLGRGGMGVVYRAWQPSLGRQVALKCLLRSGDPKSEARFAREIRALGRVEHPNVVKVFTSGADGDQWFYAMELVDGADLSAVWEKLAESSAADLSADQWIAAVSTVSAEQRQREETLSESGTRDRARPETAVIHRPSSFETATTGSAGHVTRVVEIVRQVADAAHALHEAGVIHRDIKPANILLTADGGHSVLMDLGLAQLADEAEGRLTKTRQFVGTLRYSSPEQVLSIGKLDRRADVYSLGATLWELLTLRPLFGASEEMPTPELMLKIQSTDPDRPRKHNSRIPADLEAIVLKCLEKDRSRRYATAHDLADDLGRWLRGEPVLARAAGRLERAARWVQRRPAIAAAWASLTLALLLGSFGGGALWLWRQAENARDDANTQRERAERSAVAEAAERQRAESNADIAKAEQHKAEASAAEAGRQRGMAEANAREARRQEHVTRRIQYVSDLKLAQKAFSENRLFEMQRLIRGQESAGEFKGFDWHYLNLLCRTKVVLGPKHQKASRAVAFSPDGQRVVSGGSDGAVVVWNAETGEELTRIATRNSAIDAVAFHPSGRWVASTGSDRILRIWDATTGEPIRTMTDASGMLNGLTFSPDGKWVAYSGVNSTVIVGEVETGKLKWRGTGHTKTVSGVAFSPDSRRLASASHDMTVRVWNVETGAMTQSLKPYSVKEWDAREAKEITTEYGHKAQINGIAFSPDGKTLVAADSDPAVIEWNLETGKQMLRRTTQNLPATGVSYCPDGMRVAASSADGTVCIWESGAENPQTTLYGHSNIVFGAQYSPDGTRLALGHDDGTVCVVDLTADDLVLNAFRRSEANGYYLAQSHDGKLLAQGGKNGEVYLWNADGLTLLKSWKGHSDGVQGVAFSPDGTKLVTAGQDKIARIWNVPDGTLVREFKGHTSALMAAAYHPSGRYVATGAAAELKIWDPETGREIRSLTKHTGSVVGLAFRPDGKRLVSIGGADKTMIVWNTATWEPVREPSYVAQGANGVAYSPNGRRIAAGLTDGRIILFDESVEDRESTRFLPGHNGRTMGLAFSPDGQRLVSGGFDQKVRIWDVPTGEEIFVLGNVFANVSAVDFRPDGQRVIARSYAGLLTWRCDQPPLTTQGQPRSRGNWHVEQAKKASKSKRWLAEAFHWGCMIELDPEREALYRAARAYAFKELDENARCVEDMNRVMKLRTPTARDYELRARGHFGMRQYEKAEADFGQALTLDPKYRYAWSQRGEARSRLRRWAEAIDDYNKAIALDASPTSTWRLRGIAHAELNHWADAEADFHQALERSPSTRNELFNLAIAQLGGGNLSGYRRTCVSYFERLSISKQASDWNSVGWACSVAASDAAAPAEIVRLLEKAVAADARSYAFRNTYGAALYRAGRYDDAIRELEEAVKLHGEGGSFEDWTFLAMARKRLGQADRAVADFQTAAKHADRRIHPPADGRIPLPLWSTRVEWQVLRREAEELLKSPAAANGRRGP